MGHTIYDMLVRSSLSYDMPSICCMSLLSIRCVGCSGMWYFRTWGFKILGKELAKISMCIYIYIYMYIYIYIYRERDICIYIHTYTYMRTLRNWRCGDFTPKADMCEGFWISILKPHIPEHPTHRILRKLMQQIDGMSHDNELRHCDMKLTICSAVYVASSALWFDIQPLWLW